jgi:hypothetical protein
LSVAVVTPAAFAQESGTQAGTAQPAALSSQAAQSQVTGTIVSLTADRIDLKVDSVTAPQSAQPGSSIMVGKTTAFTLNSTTELPQGLKAGDRVDLWFGSDNGSLLATRVAMAASWDQSSPNNESASSSPQSSSSQSSTSSASEQPAASDTSSSVQPATTQQSPSADQSATSGSSSSTEPSASAAEPASSPAAANGAHRENLPKTGSPLPLIGLLGLAALASVLVLRFVVRA